MQIKSIVCSMCLGKGFTTIIRPHFKDIEIEECVQCNGKKKIDVMVPDNSDYLKDNKDE